MSQFQNPVSPSITDFNTLSTQITTFESVTLTAGTGFTLNDYTAFAVANFVVFCVQVTATASYNASSTIVSFPSGKKPISSAKALKTRFTRGSAVDEVAGYAEVGTNGVLYQSYTSSGVSGDGLIITGVFRYQ